MTEPSEPDPVEPRSIPEGLGPVGAPNDLTPPQWKRTALIVWSAIAVVLFGGLAVMALTWRSAALPALPAAPELRFDLPDIASDFPVSETGAGDPDDGSKRPGRPPQDMVLSRRGEARSVAGGPKPGGDAPPRPGAPLGVLIAASPDDAGR